MPTLEENEQLSEMYELYGDAAHHWFSSNLDQINLGDGVRERNEK